MNVTTPPMASSEEAQRAELRPLKDRLVLRQHLKGCPTATERGLIA